MIVSKNRPYSMKAVHWSISEAQKQKKILAWEYILKKKHRRGSQVLYPKNNLNKVHQLQTRKLFSCQALESPTHNIYHITIKIH